MNIPKTPIQAGITHVEVDGVSRAALNSANRPIHWSIEGVQNFWRWFGNSRATDAEGRPLVAYHGTITWEERGKQLGDIDSFERTASVSIVGRRPTIDTVGSWFSTTPGKDGAGMYGDTIYPVFLLIRNPHETTFNMMLRRARLLVNGKDDGRRVGETEVDAYRTWLRAIGKDGIRIIHDDASNSLEFKNQDAWIALYPTQIKSAIGNSGLFDPQSTQIHDQAASHACRMHPGGTEHSEEPAYGPMP